MDGTKLKVGEKYTVTTNYVQYKFRDDTAKAGQVVVTDAGQWDYYMNSEIVTMLLPADKEQPYWLATQSVMALVNASWGLLNVDSDEWGDFQVNRLKYFYQSAKGEDGATYDVRAVVTLNSDIEFEGVDQNNDNKIDLFNIK